MTHEPPLLPIGETQERKEERKKEKHHAPLTMLRRSVRLMDTQASLKAKRTPDVWEEKSKTKVNYT